MKFLRTPAGKVVVAAVAGAFLVGKLMKAKADAVKDPATKTSLTYKVAETLGFGA